jgi:hypothetical protein
VPYCENGAKLKLGLPNKVARDGIDLSVEPVVSCNCCEAGAGAGVPPKRLLPLDEVPPNELLAADWVLGQDSPRRT